ncbi:DNA-binding protein [Caudoviricetes sp.]|nr:DNA-binding protein [Caudoviricetes sp.]
MTKKIKNKHSAIELTAPVRNAIAKAVREGAPWDSACRAAKVSKQILKRWIEHGRELTAKYDASGAYPEDMTQFDWDCVKLADAVDEAHSDLIYTMSRMVRSRAKKDPKIAMWLLERRDPNNFSIGRITKAMAEAVAEKPVGGSAAPQVQFYIPDNGRMLS